MKILLAATSCEAFSGASKCLIELALKLKEKQNIVVSLPKSGGDLETILTEFGITTVVIREYQCWYRDLYLADNSIILTAKKTFNELSVLKCRRFLRSEGFNIVHVNALTAYVVGKAAIDEGIPVVWHIREFMEEDLGISFVNSRWSKRLLNKATSFIAISEQIKDKWEKILTSPIKVIYDGVPIDSYYVEKKEIHEGINILLYGRVVEGKGQLQYVQAAIAALKKCSDPCNFYFAGKIEDKKYYKKCIKLIKDAGREDNIKYIGQIINIKELLAKTDIVCICSTKEGFGRVTVESMLGKCLVIGAASGATIELIEDGMNGILYEPTSVSELSDKLIECINNYQQYQKVVDKGQQIALKTFTDENNANNILKLYGELIETK